jgi:hypothetical protein
MNFTIDGGMTAEPVVGSNTYPDIFEGRVKISGQATVLFQDAVMRDYFTDETEVSVIVGLTAGDAASSAFMSFAFPRVKFGGATKDDGEKAATMTMPFTALLATTGGTSQPNEQTTLQICDSAAA